MPPSARREALGDVPEEVRASDHRCHGTSAAHSGFLLSLVIAPAFVPLIGCGQGELAGAVARRGYEIVAIDPPASDGDIFEPVSLEQFAGPGPFDAVLASRVLHNIPDLAGAVDRVARLLRPGGRLIVHEHAWERMDERTARWYLERRGRSIPPPQPLSRAAWPTGRPARI